MMPGGSSGQPRELLTVEAAAERLAVSRTTMFALIKDGTVESVRIGKLRRVPAAAIGDYIQRLITVSEPTDVGEV